MCKRALIPYRLAWEISHHIGNIPLPRSARVRQRRPSPKDAERPEVSIAGHFYATCVQEENGSARWGQSTHDVSVPLPKSRANEDQSVPVKPRALSSTLVLSHRLWAWLFESWWVGENHVSFDRVLYMSGRELRDFLKLSSVLIFVWSGHAPIDSEPVRDLTRVTSRLIALRMRADGSLIPIRSHSRLIGPYPGLGLGFELTPRKYIFDVTSIGQCSSPWPFNSKFEMKFHLECKLHWLVHNYIATNAPNERLWKYRG